jgi:hypothetical protein
MLLKHFVTFKNKHSLNGLLIAMGLCRVVSNHNSHGTTTHKMDNNCKGSVCVCVCVKAQNYWPTSSTTDWPHES